ncbi:MAG: proteasome accessory factor PafA2 family protein, partial [Myxococcales bacterium]|nr:proteasome accessory factor PafA2 family protein [Myxococcales bacterium]
MLDRLAGLETEYALRFSPAQGAERPRNDILFTALAEAIRARVRTLPGRRRLTHDQLFTENGGSVYFERSPTEPDGGLVEAATPECRGPSQLLLYQQAQEALLRRALPLAEAALARAGHPGRLGLLKNGRDADGNTYGVQENFEAPLATGPLLHLYRLGLALLIPIMLLDVVLCWALIIAAGLLLIATALTLLLADAALDALRGRRRPDILTRTFQDPERRLERRLMKALAAFEMLIVLPAVLPFTWLIHLCAFRPIRRDATAFLVSRPLITGTGTLEPDDRYGLSEKATTIRRLVRSSAAPYGRAIYDTGNLLKGLQGLFLLDFTRVLPLFARRQRLQLGLADANRCQAAEYLKLGTTLLVLDMVDAGALRDAPRLRDPVAALRTLTGDPTLRAEVPLRDGRAITGLALQRWYLDRARRYVATHPAPPLEAHQILRLWTEALDALEADPGALVGRLDWITKRYL